MDSIQAFVLFPPLPSHSTTCLLDPAERNRPETGTATSRSGPRFLCPTSVPPYCSGSEVESRMEAKMPALTAAGATTHSPAARQPFPCLKAGGRLPLPRWRTHGGLLTDSDLLLSLGLEPGQLWVGGVTPRGPSGSSCEHEGQGWGAVPFPCLSVHQVHACVCLYMCRPQGVEGSQTGTYEAGAGLDADSYPRSQPALAGLAGSFPP